MPSTAMPAKIVALVILSATLLDTGTAVAAPPGSCRDLESSVEYLMERVTRSELTFIRNGKAHAGAEAAEHMGKKYDHFRKEIRTPEDFIRLAATKSLLSGKPYAVVTADGTHVPTANWLRAALEQCRAAAADNPAAVSERRGP